MTKCSVLQVPLPAEDSLRSSGMSQYGNFDGDGKADYSGDRRDRGGGRGGNFSTHIKIAGRESRQKEELHINWKKKAMPYPS